jgi:hypothetical protein
MPWTIFYKHLQKASVAVGEPVVRTLPPYILYGETRMRCSEGRLNDSSAHD